ncbi:MAG: hypothetical protein ABR595_08880, partial [Psychroflexus sp.]
IPPPPPSGIDVEKLKNGEFNIEVEVLNLDNLNSRATFKKTYPRNFKNKQSAVVFSGGTTITYNDFIELYSFVRSVIDEQRKAYSMSHFNETFDQIDDKNKQKIVQKFPQRIALDIE